VNDFIFAVRMLLITTVIVVLMQIRVGEYSIEARTENWIKTAPSVVVLREVAEGGLLVVHDAWSSLMSNINSKYSKKFDPETVPGEREIKLGLKRSEAYLDEEKKKKESTEQRLKARSRQVREALGIDSEKDTATE
jgi:hypothetical protein